MLGASGSGKSSVVLAGLVPKLEQEGHWKFTHFRPGSDPFHALALALVPLYTPKLDDTDQIAQARKLSSYLKEKTIPLSDVLAKIQQNCQNYRLLLIADQFEELYTQCPEQKIRHSFLDSLLTSFQTSTSGSKSSTVLVITMRADFLGNALSYPLFADMLQNTEDIKLGAMSLKDLKKVIEEPPKKLGVTFETGLIERILADLENDPGNLPLLEFTLTELWNNRRGKQLTHNAYEAIGQVKGALAQYTENRYKNFTTKEQEQVRRIFIELVHLGEGTEDTRRVVTKAQLGESDWNFVNKLADERLVVTNQNAQKEQTVEVVHEALIRNWTLLRQWLDESRDKIRQKRKIEDAAGEWKSSGQKTDYLLSKKRLKEAKDFQKEEKEKYPLSQLATDFVKTSIKYQKREKIKSWGLFLIIPLMGTVIGGYLVVKEIQLNAYKKFIRDCQEKKDCHGIIEALERLVEANRSLKSYNLEDANLEGVHLRNANLESAELSGANLQRANLQNANLEGVHLRNADLSGADLSGANLFVADLRNANLPSANLFVADLSGANLTDTEKLTNKQIKLACNWEQAYFAKYWDEEKEAWVVDEEKQETKIKELKEDKASDPKEKPDCSRWKEE